MRPVISQNNATSMENNMIRLIWPPGPLVTGFGAAGLMLVLALLLSGCSEADRALINTSIDKVEYGADSAAEALVKAPCAMTLGAYFRLENPNQRDGAKLLCNPRPEL